MQVNLAEASQNLVQLVEAALHGEEIVILKDDKPVVKLTLVESINRQMIQSVEPRYPLRGLPLEVAANFDEPMPELWDALNP